MNKPDLANWFLLCGLLAGCVALPGCGRTATPDVRLHTDSQGVATGMLFYGRDVRDADLRTLNDHPEIEELALQECNQVTDAGLAHVASAPKLKKLNISRVAISDEALKALAGHDQLVELELAHTQIAGQGLKHLAALPLQRLTINSRAVTAAGLQALAELDALRQLELQCQEISLADLPALGQLKQLESLDAYYTPAGENGIEVLRGLAHLKKLVLASEHVNDDSIAAINTLTALEELHLIGSNISDNGLRSLSLPNLKMLNIDADIAITDAALGNLQGLPSLETLYAADTAIVGLDFAGLAPLKNLKEVRLALSQYKGGSEAQSELRTLLPKCKLVLVGQ